MSEVVIKFENVSKSYPMYHEMTGGLKPFLLNLPKAIKNLRRSRFESLKDISFEVKRGETFGIMGKNGAGKSTTLSLIAGVIKPTSGKVTVNGRISPLLELGAGFHHELTGRENILLNGVLLGMTKKQVLSKVDEIINFSELGEFIEQPIRTYSSGMLARLGFSVVSHLDPEILLVDEVLAVGDIGFQRKCLDKMNLFRRKGVTMVFVSHFAGEIEKLCDRAMWIDNRLVSMIGSAHEIAEAYSKSVDFFKTV